MVATVARYLREKTLALASQLPASLPSRTRQISSVEAELADSRVPRHHIL